MKSDEQKNSQPCLLCDDEPAIFGLKCTNDMLRRAEDAEKLPELYTAHGIVIAPPPSKANLLWRVADAARKVRASTVGDLSSEAIEMADALDALDAAESS